MEECQAEEITKPITALSLLHRTHFFTTFYTLLGAAHELLYS